MANKKITDLVEITSAANVDVLPIVDISADVTNKIKVENLPISTATQTALDAKQATLVSGTNIKTINSTSILGSGDVAVQPTLVSGTNIKTINSTSLLGSGNISIAANPAGTAGQIQFSDGSAFAADSNLYWDNTNKRLGISTSTPQTKVDIYANTAGTGQIRLGNIGTASAWQIGRDNLTTGRLAFISNNSEKVSFLDNFVGIGETAPTSRLQVKGSGSSSATTSLLVQNSSGAELMKVRDDGIVTFAGAIIAAGLSGSAYGLFGGEPYSPSVVLGAKSTTAGFLPPRMTTTQKNAISSPAEGLMVMDITTHKLCVYDGTSWVDLH